ncbi:MAG: sigma-54 dependent transcriptional regulator [Myxococcales bacterium]|nr:sigma-54 dependent transcriptional regulator [Myxococcales bacterium]
MSECPPSAQVLVVDDDASFRFALSKALSRHGFEVAQAESGEAALRALERGSEPDAIVLDLRMGGLDGFEVLRRIANRQSRTVVLTGHGSVGAAVEAMKLGAFSFLEKPVDAELLAPLLRQAAAESRAARRGPQTQAPPLVGEGPALRELREFVARAASSDETVALYGETGTGKEVVARQLHAHSPRAQGPFVALNAACVQRELFESELFGHRRGAFTGATSNHEGLFVAAQGGSLFIDEIAELPQDTQAKLLRALENGTIRPLGTTREVEVDVRIIAATNRDLWAEVGVGNFREDLYFRLQVLPLLLPPLRDRLEDLRPLCQHLLERIGQADKRITEAAFGLMLAHDWPGNVRELLNVLRRATLFAEGSEIDEALMRRMLLASLSGHREVQTRAPAAALQQDAQAEAATRRLADVERAHIEQVLRQMDGNITRAASALGIDRRTLQRKLKAFGLAGQD